MNSVILIRCAQSLTLSYTGEYLEDYGLDLKGNSHCRFEDKKTLDSTPVWLIAVRERMLEFCTG